MQVLVNVPVGQTACAALIQPSHLPLLTLMVAPSVTGVSVSFEVPDAPTVLVGLPPQNSIVPEMPPQIDRRATLVSWVLSAALGSLHTVPVTALGLTFVLPGSRGPMRDGWNAGWAEVVRAAAKSNMMVKVSCIF